MFNNNRLLLDKFNGKQLVCVLNITKMFLIIHYGFKYLWKNSESTVLFLFRCKTLMKN